VSTSAATLPTMAGGHYDDARVTAWSERIGAVDAFVFITAEYNHGIPGAFKNAVDLLAPEWAGKCVRFVSYGAVGGVRAVEQWRPVLANFSMVDIRSQVTLSNFTDFEPDGAVSPAARHSESARAARGARCRSSSSAARLETDTASVAAPAREQGVEQWQGGSDHQRIS